MKLQSLFSFNSSKYKNNYNQIIGTSDSTFRRKLLPRIVVEMDSYIRNTKDNEILTMFNDLALIFYNPILSSSEDVYFQRKHFINYSATAQFLSTEVNSSGDKLKLLDDFKELLHSRQINLFAWLNEGQDSFKKQDKESLKLLKEVNPDRIKITFSEGKLKSKWEEKDKSKKLSKLLSLYLGYGIIVKDSLNLHPDSLLKIHIKIYIFLAVSELDTILEFFKYIKKKGFNEDDINKKLEEVLKLENDFSIKLVELFDSISKVQISFENKEITVKITDSIKKFVSALENISKRIDNVIVCGWPRNFSTGQEALMSQFSELFSVIRNDNNETENHLKAENIIISIDEGEAYFHPEWQRKYISSLCSFLEVVNEVQGLNKKFQIILTSHSPFIVSDIPHYNLIKLQKDENGFTKVMNNQETETLGGNIFRLFQDEFFVDEFISAFAYEKIKDAIFFMDGREQNTFKNNEELIKFIDIIGEPLIRRQLKQKYELGKDKNDEDSMELI